MRLTDKSSEDMADDQDARVTYLAGQIERFRRSPARGPLTDLARARAILRALDAYAAEQTAQGKPRRRASAAPTGSGVPASA